MTDDPRRDDPDADPDVPNDPVPRHPDDPPLDEEDDQ